MDGTLLDLHFDNQFWTHHIPKKLSEKHGVPIQQCYDRMEREYAEVHGQIEWYCLDYWEDRLDLDIVTAKRELMHLIRMRDDAVPFMDALKQSNREIILVTNAHPRALALKLEQTSLDDHIQTLISSHQFGASKEFQSMWEKLHAHLQFDPKTTLFVDDGEAILDAAKQFGIAHTLGVSNPDSLGDEKQFSRHSSVNDFTSIIPHIVNQPFVSGS